MVQDHAEAELLGQAQDGEDVVVTVRVVVHDALAIEHLDQRFERQVALGELLWIARRARDLVAVGLGRDELLAHERGRLRAGAGERRVAAAVRAVRHLDPARDRPSASRIIRSSIFSPSRSLRYTVCPESRWPEPGMMFTQVRPPARARSRLAWRTSIASRTRTSGWIGAERSPPAGRPTCEWVQIRPGMIVLPVMSRRSAPAGTATSSEAPIAVIFPPWTTSVPRSISAAEIGINRAPSKAIGPSLRGSAREEEGEEQRGGAHSPEPSGVFSSALLGTGNPRSRIRASICASRPRNAR